MSRHRTHSLIVTESEKRGPLTAVAFNNLGIESSLYAKILAYQHLELGYTACFSY